MKHQIKLPPLKLNKQLGITLIELLIYIGLYAVLISVIVAIFGSILESRTQTEQVSAVSLEGERILAKFQQDIRQANQILAPAELGQQSSTLLLQIGSNTLTYTLTEAGQIQVSDNTNDQVMTHLTNINNLQFTKVGNLNGKEAVKISFDLQTNSLWLGRPETRNFQTVVVTR